MAKPDPKEEHPVKKSRLKSLFSMFSIRNGVILLLALGALAVGGRMLGLYGRPVAIENAAVSNDNQAAGEQQNMMPAMHAKSSSAPMMAGRIAADLMGKKFIALEETLTAGQAVERLKEKEVSAENPLPVYVTDSLGRLVGKCTPGKILVAPEDTPLKEMMAQKVEAVEINTDAAWIAERMRESGAAVMPVVDMAGRMVGLVSADALKAHAAGGKMAEAGGRPTAKPASEPESGVHVVRPEAGAGAQAAKTGQAAGEAESGTVAARQGRAAAGGAATTKHAVQAGEKVAVAGEKSRTAAKAEGEAGPKAAETSKPKGVAFVNAMIKPLKYELEDRFWGWRPNDILDFTDNVNEFQLGVLEVTRRTAVALAERISRTGTIEAFDPNVQNAMNWFMVKSTRYWLPSPESKYRAGIKELEKYKQRLERGEATFYTRQDNLIPLLVAYKDLLGSCEENLVKSKEEDGSPVSFFKADNYFYYAQGVASAMFTILQAVAQDFKITVESRRGMQELEHAIHWCHLATEIHPWLILDSSPGSIFANHRANLAAPISHARFHLAVLIRTLST